MKEKIETKIPFKSKFCSWVKGTSWASSQVQWKGFVRLSKAIRVHKGHRLVHAELEKCVLSLLLTSRGNWMQNVHCISPLLLFHSLLRGLFDYGSDIIKFMAVQSYQNVENNVKTWKPILLCKVRRPAPFHRPPISLPDKGDHEASPPATQPAAGTQSYPFSLRSEHKTLFKSKFPLISVERMAEIRKSPRGKSQ